MTGPGSGAPASGASAPACDLLLIGGSVVFVDGGTDALGVSFADPSGAANVRVDSSPLAQDIPTGATRTFQWTIEGTSPGTATLGTSGAATDPDTGTSFAVDPVQWTPIVF